MNRTLTAFAMICTIFSAPGWAEQAVTGGTEDVVAAAAPESDFLQLQRRFEETPVKTRISELTTEWRCRMAEASGQSSTYGLDLNDKLTAKSKFSEAHVEADLWGFGGADTGYMTGFYVRQASKDVPARFAVAK